MKRSSSALLVRIGKQTMNEQPDPSPMRISDLQNQDRALDLANQCFREFHTRCFWHSPRELVITEEMLPFLLKGLRTHGGRRGFMLAGEIQTMLSIRQIDREVPECC